MKEVNVTFLGFRSQFALLYNDRSVLENHHVSACFRLLKDDDKNIFERLTREEFRWVFKHTYFIIIKIRPLQSHLHYLLRLLQKISPKIIGHVLGHAHPVVHVHLPPGLLTSGSCGTR